MRIFLTHKAQKSLQCFQLAANKQHNNLTEPQNATATLKCWNLYNMGEPLKK